MTSHPMLFSAADWCFFRGDLPPERYYGALHSLGVDAVEMVDPSRWKAAREAGLSVITMSAPGMERGLNRREHHGELLPRIRETIAVAAAEKIPHVIVFSGNRAGQADSEGIAICAEAFGPLAAEAGKAGVSLIFEMLCAHNHPDYQGDRSGFGFALAKKVGSPSFRVLYDIYHMWRMGADVASDIRLNTALIAHLHVADSPLRNRPSPGGDIPFMDIIPRIRETGYAGHWGLEFIPQGEILAEIGEVVSRFRSLARAKQAA